MSEFQNEKKTYDKPLPKTALDEYKLALSMPIAGTRKKSTFKVSVANNQPRFMVFTGIEGDPKNGFIMGRLDTLSFMSVLEAMRLVIDGKPNEAGEYRRFDIPCKYPSKGGAEFITDSHVTIGREKSDGRIFIAVTGQDVTPIRFFFGPAECHDGWLENREPINVGLLSEIYANAWCRIFNQLVFNVLTANYVMPTPRDNSGWKPGGVSAGSSSNSKRNEAPASAAKAASSTNDFGGSDDDFFS